MSYRPTDFLFVVVFLFYDFPQFPPPPPARPCADALSPPTHGAYNCTLGATKRGVTTQHDCALTCDEHYHVEGNGVVECHEDTGVWPTVLPTCERLGGEVN